MITFNEKSGIFKLDTPHSSYLMGIVDGKYLSHLYYGKTLGGDDLAYLMQDPSMAPGPSVLPGEKVSFMDSCPVEYGTSGTGDFREPAISVWNEMGQDACELLYQGCRILEGKPGLPGLPASFGEQAQTLEIDLKDPVTGLLATLSYSVFSDTDVIARSVRAVNEGNNSLRLTRCLSACLDMEDEDFNMIALHGAWAREHLPEKRTVGYGGTVTESIRGIPGHDANPFYLLSAGNADKEHGNVYGFVLVYSGNFLGKVEKTQFGTIRAVLGIHPEKFSWLLTPGESFQAPEALLGFSADGIGALSRNYHDFIREHLIRSKYQNMPRPVLVNNWEATYFDFNEEKLLSIALAAKKAGIDMLVCDDGWFGSHRNSPSGCLGDWTENREKFPTGFPDFVKKLHAMGLKAGLWFEPESISPESELYREHPDWVLHVEDREPVQCRNQWILDLSNEGTVQYLIRSLESMIRRTGIDYIKWDMNRPLVDIGSSALPKERQGEISHRHVLAVYRIQEQILADFPDLLLENCAGGGSRFDAGMLFYSPQIWCSDDMDPVERLLIQEGTELVYPVSAMGSHVGSSPYGITSRKTDFDSRALCAMAGTFGYELDITRLPGEETAKIPGQISLYKRIQPLIQKGDYYRLASFRENGWLDCVEIAAKDRSEAIILAVQVLTQPNGRSFRMHPGGLDPDIHYRVKELRPGEMDSDTDDSDSGNVVRGDILMQAGVLLEPVLQDFYARLVVIRRV